MRVLFVDDEPLILSGIDNALLFADDDWEVDFASSGDEAVTLMTTTDYDVLVTDMQMPGLTGADLLEHAMANHPRTVRVVLSGEVDNELAARGIPLSHEFVSKPCEPDELFRILSRVYQAARSLEQSTVRVVLGALDRLPSQPGLHQQIQEALDRGERSDTIASVIETDVAVASAVVKTANSAFYGFRTPCGDVRDAVVRLGTDTVSGIVLNTEIANWATPGLQATVAALNSRSTLIADIVRKLIGGEIAQASLAGLLHNIGTLVLITQFPDEYASVQQILTDPKDSGEDAERRAFGASHAEIGGYMLEMWNADPVVVEVARFHHNPNADSVSAEARRIIAAITAVDVAQTPQRECPEWLDPGLVARATTLITNTQDRVPT